MKKIILIAAIFLPFIVFAQNKNFTIEGEITNPEKESKAYIVYFAGEKIVMDSIELKAGKFAFSGIVSSPTLVTVTLAHNGNGMRQRANPDLYTLYVDTGLSILTSKDSIKNATMSGAKLGVDYVTYTRSIAKQDYIANNPNSFFSLMAVFEMMGSTIDVDKVGPAFYKLSEDLKNSDSGKVIAQMINAAKEIKIGAIAMDFSQADPDGKQVKLSDFRGTYVLLDFWASWCGPCRQENPNVVEAFHKFKGKNFTVLGVSLDNPGKRADWLNAIEADKLDWTQLSDLQGPKNEVGLLYGVTAIPQNYLIDPEGKIVAINLRGEKLHKKLAELIEQ